ncbi:hypothetical protein [Anaerocolumna sp. MB42-C2]|uniref:hypothetical protein n=1 Tax=Anaerocolumna sp. MB42-C2 TaxID=3070997 RepID=UPI0027E02346|nr:hypothetical protein [Anaerocolumna sp. MB42-C2]WMJ87031.1 hypothetical protein RBU59_23820 [Anaerocolumna sp. MB42-C2]
MNQSMNEWLEKEMEAAQVNMKKERKKVVFGMILLLPGTILALFLIGYLSSSQDISKGFANIKYGVIFGLILELCTLPALLQNTAKRYIKILKKTIEKALPSAGEQAEFAVQMLDVTAAKKFRYINANKKEESIYITKDYFFKNYWFINCAIVRLKDVDRIELDANQYNIRLNLKGAGTRFELLPIHFFYRNLETKKDPDVTVMFCSRNDRDKAMTVIQEMTAI